MVRETPYEKLSRLVKLSHLLFVTGLVSSVAAAFLLFPSFWAPYFGVPAKTRKRNADFFLRLLSVSYLTFGVLLFVLRKTTDAKARRAILYSMVVQTSCSGVMLLRKQISDPGFIGTTVTIIVVLLAVVYGWYVVYLPEKQSAFGRMENRLDRMKQQLDQADLEKEAAERRLEEQKQRVLQLTKTNDSLTRKLAEQKQALAVAGQAKAPVPAVSGDSPSLVGSLREQVEQLKEENATLRAVKVRETSGKPRADVGVLGDVPATEAARLQRQAQLEAQARKEKKEKERIQLEERAKAKRQKEQEELAKILG